MLPCQGEKNQIVGALQDLLVERYALQASFDVLKRECKWQMSRLREAERATQILRQEFPVVHSASTNWQDELVTNVTRLEQFIELDETVVDLEHGEEDLFAAQTEDISGSAETESLQEIGEMRAEDNEATATQAEATSEALAQKSPEKTEVTAEGSESFGMFQQVSQSDSHATTDSEGILFDGTSQDEAKLQSQETLESLADFQQPVHRLIGTTKTTGTQGNRGAKEEDAEVAARTEDKLNPFDAPKAPELIQKSKRLAVQASAAHSVL